MSHNVARRTADHNAGVAARTLGQTIACTLDSIPALFTASAQLKYTGALALIIRNPSVRELDTCGLNCPLPLLKAKQALNALASGEQLRVLATDPGSQRDFRVFAEQSGHQLLESSEDNGVFAYLLQKK
jgi:tRNA 2-thiouridine synthesizing protein A